MFFFSIIFILLLLINQRRKERVLQRGAARHAARRESAARRHVKRTKTHFNTIGARLRGGHEHEAHAAAAQVNCLGVENALQLIHMRNDERRRRHHCRHLRRLIQ